MERRVHQQPPVERELFVGFSAPSYPTHVTKLADVRVTVETNSQRELHTQLDLLTVYDAVKKRG
jgi:hypothetical protein